MKIYSVVFFLLFSSSIFAQSYQNAESAEFDASHNRWLISNGHSILQRASDGTLTQFGSGTGAYGMEVMGNHVFVCDAGKTIKAYNLDTEALDMNFSVAGATFLNGLTNDGAGNLYATDFAGDKIFKINVSDLTSPASEVFIDNTIDTPNGILFDERHNRLLYVTWTSNASIRAVNLLDKTITVVQTTTLSNIDGIDEDAAGNIYVSSWTPARITKFDKDFSNPAETISGLNVSFPADIGYSQVTDTLAIPVGNDVLFIGFPKVTETKTVEKRDFALSISPNPVSELSFVSFELEKARQIQLSIIDASGRVVAQLLNEKMMGGKHHVSLASLSLAKGVYLCKMNSEQGRAAFVRFVVL